MPSSDRSRSYSSHSRSRKRRSLSRSRSPRKGERKQKKSKWDSLPSTDEASQRGFSSTPGTGGVPYAVGLLPPMSVPVEDRRGRRLYIGNLPGGVSEQAIVQFFNGALLAAAGVDYSVASASGQFPVLKAEIGPRRADAVGQADHRYCFLEFRTIADANICLKLDGISFNGFTLKVGFPNDYSAIPPSELSTGEMLAAATRGIPALAQSLESKMYVQDLPQSVTEEQLREMAERFGPVKSAALMKDLRTSTSMGCGVVEYEQPKSIEDAIKALDRQPLDGHFPRFSKVPLISAGGKFSCSNDPSDPMSGSMISGSSGPVLHTSGIVTELPTSMTYKILANAMVGAQVKAARRQGVIPTQVVQLLNTVFPEDLINDDEYEAILKDIRDEALQFGTLQDVMIPRPPSGLSFQEGVGKVFLYFSDLTAARRAQAELNGRRYEERRVICAAFYPLDRYLDGKYTLV